MTILDLCKEGKPGEICRKEWWRYRYSPLGSMSVGNLRNHLQQAKKDLINEVDSNRIETRRKITYKWAMGLLAYGGLEGLEDVLDHGTSSEVLKPRGRGEYLWFLPCLLPLPDEFEVQEVWGPYEDGELWGNQGLWIIGNAEKIRQWYQENKEHLYWDAELDRYILAEK